VTELIDIDIAALRPSAEQIVAQQGVRARGRGDPRYLALANEALALLERLAVPRAAQAENDAEAFTAIYAGEGHNEHPAPLEKIIPQTAHLALVAATLGPAISLELEARFAAHDYALAAALDAAASLAADRAGEWLEARFAAQLAATGLLPADHRVLGYSPGYCGWHVSAQRKLFAALRPAGIGLTLRESCLMEPLKSISGVLVAAPRDVHVVYDDYSFCAQCQSRSCLVRTKQLKQEMRAAAGDPDGPDSTDHR